MMTTTVQVNDEGPCAQNLPVGSTKTARANRSRTAVAALASAGRRGARDIGAALDVSQRVGVESMLGSGGRRASRVRRRSRLGKFLDSLRHGGRTEACDGP